MSSDDQVREYRKYLEEQKLASTLLVPEKLIEIKDYHKIFFQRETFEDQKEQLITEIKNYYGDSGMELRIHNSNSSLFMIGKVTVNTMLPNPDQRVKSLFATEEKEYLKS